MKILVTGGSGFVGQALINQLSHRHEITCFGRRKPIGWDGEFIEGKLENLAASELDLSGFEVVIHSAARAHVMHDESTNPLEEYRKVNTQATLALAKQAAAQGVARFVFISSVKVNGESTLDIAFSADDSINPSDDYGVSKAEAEQQLALLSESSSMDTVIIRPPLVYGPGVKANFASLFKLAGKGIPLPLGCINTNARSLVSIYNLVNFIETCSCDPNAANQTFLVSDGEDVSTRDLVEKLASVQGKSARMIPIPLSLFKLLGKVTGKSAAIDRLAGSLQVDIQKNQRVLNWEPPYTMQQSLERMMDELKSS
ncbi:NAD-dependent epimerase/dehydratase family protein [Vibrio mediterranei]|uniref:NAD-dependent epimerase/dehydratase family protein n=1 Tax=Vibrio mediterranei TaxID=689 RepID=UPI00148B5F14|nr:NAD-dependent epimerase/dehydratase family protein [Vibrio mediterranei]NOH29061.1 NAD-dependent epimerase/dehydratase family protein [Vibrio mediterranei]